MEKDYQNIYQSARNYARLSRLKASFLLNISESSLRKYESGSTVPDEMALMMSKVYRTPWLRVQHLAKNPVFCDIFGLMPVVDNKAANVLVLQKEVTDVVRVFPSIIEETLTNSSLSSRLVRECKEAANALLAIIGNEKTACADTQAVHRVL